MATKISKLEIENVKRVKAVSLEPTAKGLTVVGGRNNQGKTSVLNAIAWALGGDKYRPSEAQRDGSVLPPHLKVTLSNGYIVERSGKNSALKVIDPSGNKGGQALLNAFVETFALDLPKFIESTSKEKAQTLLNIIGVGDKLYEIESREKSLFNKRTTIGQIAEMKKGSAAEMTYYKDAPVEPVSASDLITEQQAILLKNAENQKLRERHEELVRESATGKVEVARLTEELRAAKESLTNIEHAREIAMKTAKELTDESTEALESSLAEIDDINSKVRTNQAKSLAEDEAKQYKADYDDLTGEIDTVRDEKLNLLKGAELPLEGLTVEDGELIFDGHSWDNLSSSQQLKVATAIVRKLKPECGFVLLDKLEQLDMESLHEFGEWAESENLQIIATRVSTGAECELIIEDGYVLGEPDVEVEATKSWTEGTF